MTVAQDQLQERSTEFYQELKTARGHVISSAMSQLLARRRLNAYDLHLRKGEARPVPLF
jgi:hypothetical protein